MGDDDQQQYANDDAYQGNANESMYDDDSVCMVYDKDDFFTVFVQMMLAFLALMSLYFKRMQEVPRRTFSTWALDMSKQAFGACYAHVLNMAIASIISRNIRGETELADQCAWYGISYLIDTTLGLVLAVVGLRILDWLANERDWVHLKHSGVYTGPNGWTNWIAQSIAWLFILTIGKIIIYFFMWGLSEPLAIFGGFLFAPFQANKRFELLFVMIFFPGVLNVIYFWIADSYLKAKKDAPGGAHENEEGEDNTRKEALITCADVAETEMSTNIYAPAPWSVLAGGRQEANTKIKEDSQQFVKQQESV